MVRCTKGRFPPEPLEASGTRLLAALRGDDEEWAAAVLEEADERLVRLAGMLSGGDGCAMMVVSV